MPLALQALRVRGMPEYGRREMGAPERLACAPASGKRRIVDREAELVELRRHPLGAQLAICARAGEAFEQQRIAVVDPVPQHVQVLVIGVDGRYLGRRQQREAASTSRRERLVDAIDGVVVAQREELDACGRGQFHDRCRLELAVGMARVGLEVGADHCS